MGEYALFKGSRIKIGTCEDMYYLRADQIHSVRAESGNVDPANVEHQKTVRFRFPWPDEDRADPGTFDPYMRAVAVPGDAYAFPEGLDHHIVQFTAPGYCTSLPCPEGPDGKHGLKIHRNGFPGRVQIVQQAYRNGNLALILRCGGCGASFNLPTFADAEPVIVACRAEADRAKPVFSSKWWHTVADRIAAGYAINAHAS